MRKMWVYILVILFIPICYLAWTAIHELSHIYMAHKTIGINHWELDLVPRIDIKNFQFRFAYCFYIPKRKATCKEQFAISLAPRIPDLLGAVALPLACILPEPFSYFVIVFCGASLIDWFVGSLGISEKSDLRKAASSLCMSPWIIRIWGFFGIITSISWSIKILNEKGWF